LLKGGHCASNANVTDQRESLNALAHKSRTLSIPGYGLLELAHQAWSKIDVRTLLADQISHFVATRRQTSTAVPTRGDRIYYRYKLDKPEKSLPTFFLSVQAKKEPALLQTGVGQSL